MPILGLWGMSSVYYIDDAGYQSIFDEKKNMAQYRAQNGKLYQYKFSQWREWNYPVSNVASATAVGINEWWRTGSGMMIMPDVSSLAPISILYTNSIRAGMNTQDVAYSSIDDRLWFIESNSSTVYQITKSATLISCFSSTISIDSAAGTNTGITYDSSNDRLWLADITTDKIYQITKSATLISCFSSTISIDSAAGTIFGITYDSSNDRLWLADITTDKIYQITKSATLVSYFSINSVTNVLSTGFTQGGIAYNSKTDKIALYEVGRNFVYEITKSGTIAHSALSMTNIDSAGAVVGGRGITYDNYTQRYFVINAETAKIYELPNYYAVKFTSDKAPFNKYPTPHFAQRFDGTIQLAEDNP